MRFIAPSADQIAASHLGLYTVLPSLELGTRKNEQTGTGQEGLNNRYYTTGNYRTATQPLPVEISPAEVMKRLFASRQSTPKKKGGPEVDAAGEQGCHDHGAVDVVGQAGRPDQHRSAPLNFEERCPFSCDHHVAP